MKNQQKNGFTLVELVMVIAILSIITTLAVQRFGNMQAIAARKVSIASQQAVGRAVESFLSVNRGTGLNRLDALVGYGVTGGAHGFRYGDAATLGLYCGPTDLGSLDAATVARKNQGLSDGLRDVLCTYTIDAAESRALRDIGLVYVMRHSLKAEGLSASQGDDNAYPQVSDGLDPELSACLATFVTDNLVCAAVSGKTEAGRAIYRDCGAELLSSDAGGSYSDAGVLEEIEAAGGPLLAFGVGPAASIVGAASMGLEAAPYSEILQTNRYRQYIVLFRLRRHAGTEAVTAEFAGVLDPEGHTLRAARRLLN
jgi:prepilin-type N-terminal cleavage/methylation domain-containing protein